MGALNEKAGLPKKGKKTTSTCCNKPKKGLRAYKTEGKAFVDPLAIPARRRGTPQKERRKGGTISKRFFVWNEQYPKPGEKVVNPVYLPFCRRRRDLEEKKKGRLKDEGRSCMPMKAMGLKEGGGTGGRGSRPSRRIHSLRGEKKSVGRGARVVESEAGGLQRIGR